VFALAMVCVLTWVALSLDPWNALLAGATVIGPLYALYRMFSVRTIADVKGVHVRSYIGATRALRWDQVSDVHVGPPRGRITLWDRVRIRAEAPRDRSLWIECVDGSAVRVRSLQFSWWSDRRQREAADALNMLRSTTTP
jgi:hypothetical protein